MKGFDLKLKRIRNRIKARDLAAFIGVTPSRINTVEKQDIVTPAWTRRYLAALEKLMAGQGQDGQQDD